MKTLDSLPREDLLAMLQRMIDLHSTISASEKAAEETQKRIDSASKDHRRKELQRKAKTIFTLGTEKRKRIDKESGRCH